MSTLQHIQCPQRFYNDPTRTKKKQIFYWGHSATAKIEHLKKLIVYDISEVSFFSSPKSCV
jgi:hypothetical protein